MKRESNVTPIGVVYGKMDRGELIAEIKRIDKLIETAAKRATALDKVAGNAIDHAMAQHALLEKLTAAALRVQLLLRKLNAKKARAR